jgi:DNA processing protein
VDLEMSQSALRFGSRQAFLPDLPEAISPLRELGAYEALWSRPGMSFKKLAQLFRDHPEALPSELAESQEAAEMATRVLALLRDRGVERFGLRIHRAGEYPDKLRDARDPVELLYFQGVWELTETRSVAIVGTREPSDDGRTRTRRLARALAKDGITVVSGLAAGIDTEAHTAAIEAGGHTIAVIGTPLGEVYPRDNRGLQDQIARSFLVISQVPVYRYAQQTPRFNRLFFRERNVTMSALTEATIIVEAGETSGTLIQARAAIEQGRKLFILDNCFQRGLSWPEKYLARGAIRVRDYDDIRSTLRHEAPAD